jgi:hypothetical protein
MKNIEKIINSKKTVFNYNDMKNLIWVSNKNTIKSFFSRLVKSEVLKNIYKWIYCLKDYDILELSVKLKNNSYISFETVLKKEWVIFQDYGNTIFLASDNSINKNLLEYNFKYLKLKNSILTNPIWLINKWNYIIASKERAICDRIYLSKNYYFDNLEGINKEKILEISQIYNKRVILEVKKLLENA